MLEPIDQKSMLDSKKNSFVSKHSSFVEGEIDPEFLKKRFTNFECFVSQLHPRKLLTGTMQAGQNHSAHKSPNTAINMKDPNLKQNLLQTSAFKTINGQLSKPELTVDQKGMASPVEPKTMTNKIMFTTAMTHNLAKARSIFKNTLNPVTENNNESNPASRRQNEQDNASKVPSESNGNTDQGYLQLNGASIDHDLNAIIGDLKSLSIKYNLKELKSAIEKLQSFDQRTKSGFANFANKENSGLIQQVERHKSAAKGIDGQHLKQADARIFHHNTTVKKNFDSISGKKPFIKTQDENQMTALQALQDFRQSYQSLLANNVNQGKGFDRQLSSKAKTPLLSRNTSAVTVRQKAELILQKKESIITEAESKERPVKISMSKTKMLLLTKFLVLQSLLKKRKKEKGRQETKNVLDAEIGSLKQLHMDEKKLAQLKKAVLRQGMGDLEQGQFNRHSEVQDNSVFEETFQKGEKGLEAQGYLNRALCKVTRVHEITQGTLIRIKSKSRRRSVICLVLRTLPI